MEVKGVSIFYILVCLAVKIAAVGFNLLQACQIVLLEKRLINDDYNERK